MIAVKRNFEEFKIWEIRHPKKKKLGGEGPLGNKGCSIALRQSILAGIRR